MNATNMTQRHVWRNVSCHLNAALDGLDQQSIDAELIRTLPEDDPRLAILADRAARRAVR